MTKKEMKANPATAFAGDYRLLWDQPVFLREFIEAVKKQAPEVTESMRQDIILREDEWALDGPSDVRFAVECLWAEEEGRFDDRTATASALRLVREKLWPWAEARRLVLPFGSLQNIDSESRLNGHDPMVKYHAAVLVSVFDALKVWATNPRKPRDASAWTVKVDEAVPFTLFSDLQILHGVKGMLEHGDLPPELVTIDRGPAVEYRLELSVPAWDPLSETKATARQRILDRVASCLDRKFAAVGAMMGRAQEVGVAPSYFDPLHFDWLVRYQVLERPYQRLIEEGEQKRTRQAVYHGVDSAARYLVGPRFEQWLRKSPRGRPKSS